MDQIKMRNVCTIMSNHACNCSGKPADMHALHHAAKLTVYTMI